MWKIEGKLREKRRRGKFSHVSSGINSAFTIISRRFAFSYLLTRLPEGHFGCVYLGRSLFRTGDEERSGQDINHLNGFCNLDLALLSR
jgi:hypothetical protein